MPRIALITLAAVLGLSSLPSTSEAQNPAPEYDLDALAIASIMNSGSETLKLSDVPQRVSLLIRAARILPASQHGQAVHLLDLALLALKDWKISQDKATWSQRHSAETLRNEILAAYSKLDPERTTALQKQFLAESERTTNKGETEFLKRENWTSQFSSRRAIADQSAKIALSLVYTDDEKAVALIVQSLQTGVVSRFVFDLVQGLIESGRRASLEKIEIAMGQALAANVTLEPSSLVYASSLAQLDKDMSPTVRSSFLSFLMRSLEVWSNLVKEPGIDAFYIRTTFTMFFLNVRPVILQYAAEKLLTFDLILNEVAPLVPEQTRARLEAFQPEKFSEPRDKLNDILKDPNAERRDLRLIKLVSQLMRDGSEDLEKNLDLAAEAIGGFSDPDVKSAFADRLTITRVNSVAKQKKFIEAQRLANSISSDETRAWTLLALSKVAARTDPVVGFELISNALKALDKASPSPHKVELALTATAMFTTNDPERAFDTFSVASRYANSSAAKVNPPTKPPVAFGLEAAIGDAHTKLGVIPETLADLRIDPPVSVLGTVDWFRANEIADSIREPALRLRLKLQFAEAVLAQGSKPKKKVTTPKPSLKID